eukprot:GEMP01037534.1.p1 GENE.GEMP01037534.1~~GEMP01037534.1.p1  ORF type:complete len:414 (-),score=103.88 GEMP01037534.1:575-1816(-)
MEDPFPRFVPVQPRSDEIIVRIASNACPDEGGLDENAIALCMWKHTVTFAFPRERLEHLRSTQDVKLERTDDAVVLTIQPGLLSATALREAFEAGIDVHRGGDSSVAQRLCACFWQGRSMTCKDLPPISVRTLPEVLCLAQRLGFHDVEEECYWLLRILVETARIPPDWTSESSDQTRMSNGELRHHGVSVSLFSLRIPAQSPMPPITSGYTLCQVYRDKDDLGEIFRLCYDNDVCALWAVRQREHPLTRIYEGPPQPVDQMPLLHQGYKGVVESNFWGTEFTLYDAGGDEKVQQTMACHPRNFLQLCQFEANVSGDYPRKVRVTMPGQPTFQNNPPKWDAKINSYSLPFFGRVKIASAKNFQLVQPPDMSDILLMFGKVRPGVFALDFRHPFGMMEAFTVALSAMSKKRAVS